MNIDEIKQQIDFLSEKIDLINTNLQFNITTFLAIMSVALVIAGGALILLVKNTVNKRVEEKLDKKIEEIKKSIIKEFEEKDFKYEMPIYDSWKVIQPVMLHRDKEGYINIKGAVSNDGDINQIYYLPILCLPHGFRPKEKLIVSVLNFECNGKCEIDNNGNMFLRQGNTKYIQFDFTFKQDEKYIK